MYCKKCGGFINEGDAFCGNCGTPVGEEKADNSETTDTKTSLVNNSENKKAKASSGNTEKVINFVKLYFKKPITFFADLSDFDALRTSISLLLSLSVISGLLNIWYSSAVVNYIMSSIKKFPDYLAEAGVIKSSEAALAKSNLLMAQGLVDFRQNINAMIDKRDLFISGFIQVFALVIITGLIVTALNVLILKQQANFKAVLLVSSASYIPLVISFLVSIIVTYFSLLFGIFVMAFGFILSCITLFNGVKELNKASGDNVFIIMVILFVIISLIATVYLNLQIKDIFTSVSQMLSEVKSVI